LFVSKTGQTLVKSYTKLLAHLHIDGTARNIPTDALPPIALYNTDFLSSASPLAQSLLSTGFQFASYIVRDHTAKYEAIQASGNYRWHNNNVI
jgi:hypothetical protein